MKSGPLGVIPAGLCLFFEFVADEFGNLILFVGDETRIGLKYRLLASCSSSINSWQFKLN